MPETLEKCENCRRIIGKLEKPCIWQEAIVCAECWGRLQKASPVSRGVAPLATASTAIRSAVTTPAQRPAKTPRWRVRRWAIIAGAAVVLCLVLGLIAVVGTERGRYLVSKDPGLRVEQTEGPAFLWGITNTDAAVLVIQRVVFNGEFDSYPVTPPTFHRGRAYSSVGGLMALPAHVSIGQTVYFNQVGDIEVIDERSSGSERRDQGGPSAAGEGATRPRDALADRPGAPQTQPSSFKAKPTTELPTVVRPDEALQDSSRPAAGPTVGPSARLTTGPIAPPPGSAQLPSVGPPVGNGPGEARLSTQPPVTYRLLPRYDKEVIFIDFYTNRGTFRFTVGKGFGR